MFGTKGSHWRKLDNAAKIFPATSNKKDTRVFRFYCELKDPTDGSILQSALDKTIDKYLFSYPSCVKAFSGIIWKKAT